MGARNWRSPDVVAGGIPSRQRLRGTALAVAVALTASVLAATPPAAGQDDGSGEPSAGLAVEITSPADGAATDDGEVTLEGVVRLAGEEAIADTSAVVVFDVSGSVRDPAADCTGDGVVDSILVL